MPHALVTGASGFAGSFLVRHLLAEGCEVVGIIHGHRNKLPGEYRVIGVDLTNRDAIKRIVAQVKPDEIYHLAGVTRPASDSVEQFYTVNLGGTLNLLEAVREETPGARVLLVGSAYAYGKVDHPIAEMEPFEPVNHYGVSKAAADMLGRSYAMQGFHVVNARPFNHSGPGQSPEFVLPTLVEQFAEIKAGKRDPILRLGNLDSVRDLSDVRDVVRAYRLILLRGHPGAAYNIGSGRGISVRKLFELVRRQAGVDADVTVEHSRTRATDIPYLVADVSKARRELGWKAEIPLEKTIWDMLDAVQNRLMASNEESDS